MLPNNEGDLHYNQLAESSWKSEQELQAKIESLEAELDRLKTEHREHMLRLREYFQAKSKVLFNPSHEIEGIIKRRDELEKRVLLELEKFTEQEQQELPFKD